MRSLEPMKWLRESSARMLIPYLDKLASKSKTGFVAPGLLAEVVSKVGSAMLADMPANPHDGREQLHLLLVVWLQG